MTNTKTYNGWTNYETWLLNLHFDDCFLEQANEFYQDAEPNDIFSKASNAAFTLADEIKSYVEESIEGSHNDFINDLVNSALCEVNYYEIAKHYIQEIMNDDDSFDFVKKEAAND